MNCGCWYGDGVSLQPGGGSGSTDKRYGVPLTGDYNGSNREFAVPEVFLHTPPTEAIQLYHGGRRLKHEEFEVFESVVGGGFDRVRILAFIPRSKSKLFADYTPA